MFKTSGLGLAAAMAVLSASTPAVAQTPAPSNNYTYVGQWQVPRANRAAFVADFEKNTQPVLEKLAASGTLTSWGAFEMIVHTEEGYTHGVWWSSASHAGIDATLTELTKGNAASTSLAAATKHRDYYMRSVAGNGKPASGSGGFLTVSQYLLKPGAAPEWRQLWDKYTKPIYDDLVAKGVLDGYAIDVEDVHTESPGWRFIVTLTPNAAAEDKFGAAIDAANEKRTPEERKTLASQQAAVLEPGVHRDMYAKIIRHWSK